MKTTGSHLARSSAYNFLSAALPLLAAVFTAPILIHRLGVSRFGLLNLAWVLIGYFSLFDFGLGRALTQLVARHIGAGREEETPPLIWTGLTIMGSFGAAGALAVAALAGVIARSVEAPADLRGEAQAALYLMSLSIPFVIMTAGLRGVLEAKQRFDLTSALRLPMGLYSYLGPLAVTCVTARLTWVVAALLVGRVVAWTAHVYFCLRVVPSLAARREVILGLAPDLLRFGGWMTVSNVVGPIMVNLDRFLIGALVSVSAVAYYATPFDTITQMWVISSAVTAVLFPAFATQLTEEEKYDPLHLERGVRLIFLTVFPLALVVFTFAGEGLRLWLGSDFEQQGAGVVRWIMLGVLLNCVAQVPAAFLQGIGRPDLTAKLHLLELPVYLLSLWALTSRWGIIGTAAAWTLRVVADGILLFTLSGRYLRGTGRVMRRLAAGSLLALLVLMVGGLLPGAVVKAAYCLAVLVAFVVFGWFVVMTPGERRAILGRLGNPAALRFFAG
jgi:O-antigen/teichoic acid export membrane protein